MHELLDSIAALPDIKLNAHEIKFIARQFKKNPDLNGCSFQRILHKTAFIMDASTVDFAKTYLDTLNEIVHMLDAWRVILETVFNKHNTVLNSDLLVPLSIEILPPNYDYARALKKFDLLTQLVNTAECGFLLTTLNIALEYKIRTTGKQVEETEEEQILAPIVHELKESNVDINTKLHFFCIKQRLINTCEKMQAAIKIELISLAAEMVYYQAGKRVDDKEKIVALLIAEVLTGNITFVGNREILRLLECYDAMDVLRLYGKNSADTDDVLLLQFSAQLKHFQTELSPIKLEPSLLVKFNYFSSVKAPFDPFHELREILLAEEKPQAEKTLQMYV